MFYGFVAFITVGLLYSYQYVWKARGWMELAYGLGGLFIMGLGIRAVLQVHGRMSAWRPRGRRVHAAVRRAVGRARRVAGDRGRGAVEWFSLMPRKKKTKPAARKHKSKKSRPKSQSARKRSVKKQKPESEVLPVLNSDKLKELYTTMVKCHMLAGRRLQSTQAPKQKSSHSVSGFEATLVGAGAHLLSQDWIVLEHGSFAGSLIKGTPLVTAGTNQRTPDG